MTPAPWALKLIFRHLSIFGAATRPAQKWMNLFAFVGFAFGVAAWLVVMSVMDGLQTRIKDRVLEDGAHLLWEGTPRSDLPVEELTKSYKFKSVLQSEGLLEVSDPTSSKGRVVGSGVLLQGIEGLEEAQVTEGLMARFDLVPGSQVFLRSPWRLEAAPLEIQVGSSFFDYTQPEGIEVVRVPKKTLEEWLGFRNAISRIEIQIENPMKVEVEKIKIEKLMGVSFQTWKEHKASLWYSLKLEKITMSLAMAFVILLAALSIYLSMSLRIVDKAREIGVLRALGAPATELRKLYLWEGSLLGITGCLVGVFLAWTIVYFLQNSDQFHFSRVFVDTKIPALWNTTQAVWIATLAFVVGFLASLIPTKKILSIEVQEALRS